jgi:MFS family permease
VFGVFWGGWAVAAVDVERDLSLSHATFGVLLSLSLGGAAVANAVGGALAERHGTQRTLSIAFLLWAVSLFAGAAAGSKVTFGAALIAVVSLGGAVDVVMNVAATSGLAGEPGKLVRFHAFFNFGAAIGAGSVGVATANNISWRWSWLLLGVASVLLAVVLSRAELPAGAAGESVPLGGALALLRRERLGLVAIAFAIGALVEGGVDLWGVIFLRTTLPSGLAVGATSAVIGYLVSTAARVLLGPSAGRRGPARGVTLGAGVACAGVVVLALSGTPVVAGAGLVLAAGGISLCWPLLLSLAAAGRERPGAAVGAVSSIGYLGFVVGPSVVGWLAAGFGLKAGLLFLAVAAAFVAIAPAGRSLRVGS